MTDTTPAPDALVSAARPAAWTTRSGTAESLHHGTGVAVGPDGATVAALGDPEVVVLPRSALKLLHAVALLEAGLDVDGELLAVVCGSHSAEPGHLAVVRRLLEHAGLDESHLDNTPDLPIDEQASLRWRQEHGGPARITQNCSGNHAGMLAGCVAAGWPTEGYTRADHPVQQQIAATVARLAGWVGPDAAVDGCGAPAFAVRLSGLARAFATIVEAAAGTPEARVAAAVAGNPWLVGGTGRRNTLMMGAVPGLVAKDGAEGIMAAALPGRGAVAVKVWDGTDRARGVLTAAGLRTLGVDVADDAPGVGEPVLGHGEVVGRVVGLPWT